MKWRSLIFRFWPGYWHQHLLKVATEYALGFVVVGSAITAPIVITSRHTSPPTPPHIVAKVTSQNAPAPALSDPATPKPQPAVPAPMPAPAAQTPPATPAPTPIASSAPTPGSGAKSLAPAGNSQSSSTPPQNSPTNTPTGQQTPPANEPGSSSPPAATGGYTSANWSGYVATAGGYTGISASWIVPASSGNGSSASADATWIGIGGVSASDLIQIGSEDSVSASGQDQPGAFYEMLPAPALLITALPISSGDSMSAAITEVSASTWQLSITDNTTALTYTTTVSYNSSNSSAEWIEEDPSYQNGAQVPLDNFGSVAFSSASASANRVIVTIASAGGQPITLVSSSGQALATPSVLVSNGTGFVVTQAASQ